MLEGIEVKGDIKPGYERVLTRDALQFVADAAWSASVSAAAGAA